MSLPQARPGAPQEQDIRAELLIATLVGLERAGVPWCLASGYALDPAGGNDLGGRQAPGERAELYAARVQSELDPHDVDIVVARERFRDVPAALAAEPFLMFVQARAYSATSARYDVVSFTPGGRPVVLGIDVSSEVREFGTVLLRSEDLLTGRRRLGPLFWVPTPAAQFTFSLLKRLRKGLAQADAAPDRAHEVRLSSLYHMDPGGCRRQLLRFFPRAGAERIAGAAERCAWGPLGAQVPALRSALARKLARARPQDVLRYRLGEWLRRARRVVRPTGVMVVFMGLDGSGKSTVMTRLLNDLVDVFPVGKCYHQRPRRSWRGAEDETVGGPRPMPRRGLVPSLAKLALWWLDYWTGFLVDIAPRLIQSNLVLFDRYYYDLLVDPDRYRYGGPLSVARGLVPFLPRPHLTILLDAPPEVSDARRRDGQFRSTTERREAYVALVRRLPGGRVVDASRPLDQVLADVERLILSHMEGRMARRTHR